MTATENQPPRVGKEGAIMSTTTTSLGGRLPLAERSALTGAQLELFDRFIAESVPWAQRSGFVMQSADGALIGPFNPLLQSPEISASFWWTTRSPRSGTPRCLAANGKS
jgi:hypothetical protein